VDDGELVAGADDEEFVGCETVVVGRGGFLAGREILEFREALGDDGAGGDGVVIVAVAVGEALDAEIEQVGVRGDAVLGAAGLDLGRERVTRVAFGALGEGDFHVAHFGDEAGVGERLRDLAEEFQHLVGGLQVEGGRVELHAVRLGDFGAGLDAEEGVVRGGVGLFDVVDVVRADRLELVFLGEAEEAGDDVALLGDAVVLEFDEVVFAAEDLDVAGAGGVGLLLAVAHEVLADLGGEAAGEADQTLGVFREGGEVGAGLVVETLQVGVGDQLEEVLVALEILGQDAEVEVAFAVLGFAGFFET